MHEQEYEIFHWVECNSGKQQNTEIRKALIPRWRTNHRMCMCRNGRGPDRWGGRTFNMSHCRGVSWIKWAKSQLMGFMKCYLFKWLFLDICYTGLVGHVSQCTHGDQNSSMECASHSIFTKAPCSELRLPGLHSTYPLNQEVAPEMLFN